jgi:hypothetical protein
MISFRLYSSLILSSKAAYLSLILALSGCAGTSSFGSAEQNVQLISKAEIAAAKDNLSEQIVIPLSGDEPIIEIVRPSVQGGKVSTPVAIEVRFKPGAGKKIDPASFKLFYGAFKLDVTARLLKTAKVTAEGFSISNVEIPAGEHRLVLRVSDDTGASGIKELRVKVES